MKCTCATFKRGGVRFTMFRDRGCPKHGDGQEPEPQGRAHEDDAVMRLVEREAEQNTRPAAGKDTKR